MQSDPLIIKFCNLIDLRLHSTFLRVAIFSTSYSGRLGELRLGQTGPSRIGRFAKRLFIDIAQK